MDEHHRGFRSLKNARFNAWMYGLNAYNEAYPEYTYNYPFYGYGYPIADWLSYQHYYPNYYPTYYPNYYPYYYWVNNYNNLAKKYNELQLDENMYLKNEFEQPSATILPKENALIDIPNTDTVDEERQNVNIPKNICVSDFGISKEFTNTLDVPVENVPDENMIVTYETFYTYYTVDTYDTIHTFDEIIPN